LQSHIHDLKFAQGVVFYRDRKAPALLHFCGPDLGELNHAASGSTSRRRQVAQAASYSSVEGKVDTNNNRGR
ncbi:unnamed protein product, partial [Amoebophrya sp. A25]